MFKNHYDTDITTWSPAGRLYQIEYAAEAVKQGAPTVGVKSNTHVVLTALKRSPTQELSSYQEKVFQIAGHVGMAVSGLVSDARVLSRFMRSLCMDHEYLCGTPLPVTRLTEALSLKHQRHTQSSSKRPFGVGLLVAGYDSANGPQLVQTAPSGDVYLFKATAIGSRSQSARTYLEKHFKSFAECPVDELVLHALKALSSTAGEGTTLTTQNVTIAVVGRDTPFRMYSDEGARPFLNQLNASPVEPIPAVEDEAEPPETGEVPMVIEEEQDPPVDPQP